MAEEHVIHIDLDEIRSRKTVVLTASSAQIRSIKKLLSLADNRVESLGDGIYKLTVSSSKVLVPKILEEMTLNDISRKSKPKRKRLPDFVNSEKFYAGSRVSRGYKIISDEFSDIRNRELYKGFQLIEHKWRQAIVIAYSQQNKQVDKPVRYKKKASDHAISTYELTEFFEQFLYAPASEEYKRKQWRLSTTKTEDDMMRIANLKQLNEIGFGLDPAKLETIRDRRNQCMHFRIVTNQEYVETVPLINEYLQSQAWKEFTTKLTKTASVSLQEAVAQAQEAARAVIEGLALSKFTMPTIPKITMPNLPSFSSTLWAMYGDGNNASSGLDEPEESSDTDDKKPDNPDDEEQEETNKKDEDPNK